MTAVPLELARLQEWMSILIRHSRDSAAGARSAAARSIVPLSRARAGDVVVPNERMSVFQRLDVYNGGYFGRLKEVLESDFAALVHALGEHDWYHLALGYVERHPSGHPNLNVFNRRMPDYIASRSMPHRAFLRDLAKLEVTITEAFDAPAFTPVEMQTLARLTPEQWAEVRLVPNPSLRLLTSGYAVNRYLQMVYDGREPPTVHAEAPARLRTHLAVYRKDYKVWRLDLPRPMFLVLQALVEGQPLAAAIAAGGEHDEDFQHWFREWSGDGLFVAAEC